MKNLWIYNARLGAPDGPLGSILISDGKVVAAGPEVGPVAGAELLDAGGNVAIPGLVDLHVHLREPGFEYKETIASGTRAAAAGGFTTVCAMPNINPVPDDMPSLQRQLDIIARDALVEVLPYASITRKRMGQELTDHAALAPYVAGFSDDGTGVDSEEMMLQAMKSIAAAGRPLAEHCEVQELVRGGCIHDGEFARKHGYPGICSESEWREVERNIRLAEQTGCPLHICHVSTKESCELIRQAKARGVNVTGETGAHYIAFCDADMQEEGRFKMNPPLRSAEDREALIRAIADGTLDCIASDHAPHSAEEKSRGLKQSAMGVTGLELSLPAMYTYGVLPGHISFERMIELMATTPRRIFGIQGGMQPGMRADIAIVDFDTPFTVDPASFLSQGKATPFEGCQLRGKVRATVCNGKLVYTSL